MLVQHGALPKAALSEPPQAEHEAVPNTFARSAATDAVRNSVLSTADAHNANAQLSRNELGTFLSAHATYAPFAAWLLDAAARRFQRHASQDFAEHFSRIGAQSGGTDPHRTLSTSDQISAFVAKVPESRAQGSSHSL